MGGKYFWMKVALVTNYNEICGISSYAENLVRFKDPRVEYKIIFDVSLEEALSEIETCDAVHINFHRGISSIDKLPSLDIISSIKPTIVTSHNIDVIPKWAYRRALVTHVDVPAIRQHFPHLKVIPHGIPEYALNGAREEKLVITQCGYAYPNKNTEACAWAASRINERNIDVSMKLFMPAGRLNPASEIEKCEKHLYPNIPREYVTHWMSEEEVIQRLHRETSVAVFWTQDFEGPSGSIRMAIAAHKPVVISPANRYVDIMGEEGVFIAEDSDSIPDRILEAYDSRITTEILAKKLSYFNTCKQYADLYEEII